MHARFVLVLTAIVVGILSGPAASAVPPYSATLMLDPAKPPLSCPATLNFVGKIGRAEPLPSWDSGVSLRYSVVGDQTDTAKTVSINRGQASAAVTFALPVSSSHTGWLTLQLAPPYQATASNRVTYRLTCGNGKATLETGVPWPPPSSPLPTPLITPAAAPADACAHDAAAPVAISPCSGPPGTKLVIYPLRVLHDVPLKLQFFAVAGPGSWETAIVAAGGKFGAAAPDPAACPHGSLWAIFMLDGIGVAHQYKVGTFKLDCRSVPTSSP